MAPLLGAQAASFGRSSTGPAPARAVAGRLGGPSAQAAHGLRSTLPAVPLAQSRILVPIVTPVVRDPVPVLLETQAGALMRLQGTVVSTAPMKTCVVAVDRYAPHPKYKKMMRHTKKYMAHDEYEVAKLGDRVTIEQSRPLSARKRFRLHSIDIRPKFVHK